MKLLRAPAASDYLKNTHGVIRTPETLRNYRHKGGGPDYLKLGLEVYYEPQALDTWVAKKLSKPLSSTSQQASTAKRYADGNTPSDSAISHREEA